MSTDVVGLSKSLLGKQLCTCFAGVLTTGTIVETEAYRAPDDKASHAFANKRTRRTETMFALGGCCYVYLCYGIHHLFNVVTGPENIAHAVLIRAIEPLHGIHTMQKRRGLKTLTSRLTAGPGILSEALGIKTAHDGLDLTTQHLVWISDLGNNIEETNIISSPRVGVDYAEECASWNWRFRIKNNHWSSKPN